MQVEKLDIENFDKLLQVVLKKAQMKFTGEEALAFQELVMYCVKFRNKMKESMVAPAAASVGKKK